MSFISFLAFLFVPLILHIFWCVCASCLCIYSSFDMVCPSVVFPNLAMSAEAARKREEKAKATLDPTTHWAAPEVVNREAVPKILGIRPFLRRQPSLTLLLEP